MTAARAGEVGLRPARLHDVAEALRDADARLSTNCLGDTGERQMGAARRMQS
ncbi:MAG: hypothetical protein ACLQRM_20060 [Acidimicrobiales bacterium]